MDRLSYRTLALIMVLLAIPIVFLFRINQKGRLVEAGWYNDSWGYRQRLDITNTSSAAQTNFVTQLSIGTSALIGAGKMQADCDDIRITDATGTLLPYFISNCGDVTTYLWTKLPTLPTSGAAIYVYYGNFQAPVYANAQATFDITSETVTTGSSAYSNAVSSAAVAMVSTPENGVTPLSQNGMIKFTGANDATVANHYAYYKLSTASGDYLKDYVIEAGDYLTYLAYGYSGPSVSVEIDFTDGDSLRGSHVDQNNVDIQTPNPNSVGHWYWRYFDLSDKVGKTINRVDVQQEDNTASVSWTAYYNNIVIRKHNKLTTTALTAAEETSPGPIAYWKFDEGVGSTIHDSTVNDADAVFSGTKNPVWANDSQCLSGKCTYYDATNYQSIVTTKDITAGWSPTNDFTLSLWFKCNGEGISVGSTQYNYLAGLFIHGTSAENGNPGFYLRQNSISCTGVQFDVGASGSTGSSKIITGTLTTPNLNIWHHLVAQKSSDTLLIYDNGVLINSQTFTGTPWLVATNQETRIGSVHGRSIKGYIDEVKIYPYARSIAQIKQDYAAGISGQSSSKGSATSFGSSSSGKSLTDGLVGHWKMDDTSTTLTDASGNGNTGAVTGSSNFTAGKFGTAFRAGIGTTNLITNPSFETDLTNWSPYQVVFSRGTSGTVIGSSAAQIGWSGIASSNSQIYSYVTSNTSVGVSYTLTAYLSGTGTVVLSTYDNVLGYQDGSTINLTTTPTRYSITRTYGAGSTDRRVLIRGFDSAGDTAYVDGFQLEASATYTPYIDGSMGIGTSWTGTAHASTSVRTASLASVSNSTSLDIATTAISYSAWINPKLYPDTYGVVFQKSGYLSGYRLMLRSNGGLYLSIGETGGGWMNSTGTLPPNTWSQVALTYDGRTMRTYINGQLDSTKAYSAPLVASTSGISFGATEYPPITGYIDDVRIYNRPLSPSDITSLYSSAPGPVAYFNFDDKSTTGAQDVSGNSNNATYYNSPSPTTGKYGNGLRLSTDNRYAGSTISPTTSSSQYTLESWINFNSVSGIQRILYPQGSSLNQIGINNGQIFVHVNSTSGSDTNVGNTNYPTNCQTGWHHLALTVDTNLSANNVKVFCDGVNFMNGTLTNAKNGLFSFNGLYIGYNSSSQSVSGTVDEVKIYNYTRSPAQIAEDMGTGPGSKKPIAYYKFDEGFGTISANLGNAGIGASAVFAPGSSAPTWSNDGKLSKAVKFDGDNDRIIINDNDSLDMRNTGYTVTAWLKAQTSSIGSHDIIASKGGSSAGNAGYWWGVNTSGYMDLYISDGSSHIINGVLSNGVITTNTWRHVAFTWDPAIGAIMYVDGKLDKNIPITSAVDINSANPLILGGYAASGYTLNGLLDEVKIYPYALTPDNIKTDYNNNAIAVFGQSTASSGSTAPGGSSSQEYCIPGSVDPCLPPIIEWKLDEANGSTANDTSGHSVAGTLGSGTSAPLWTTGKIGSALNFSTPGQVVTASTSNLPSNTFTQSAWIYPTSYTGSGNNNDRNTIIYANDKYLQLQNDQKIGVYISGLTAPGYHTSISSIPLNQWTHVAYSWNGSTIIIYINGIIDKTIPNTGNASLVMSDFRIGYQTAAYERQFDGKVDQVKVYDYARSSAQIAWDYNQGKPIAHWKLDECEGTTVHSTNDTYLTGLNGTISIGASGTQTSAGTCSTSSTAWGSGTTGRINSSLNFDGSDDYFQVSQFLADTTPVNITISGWIKPNDHNSYFITPSTNGLDQWIGYQGSSNQRLQLYLTETANTNQRGRYSSTGSVPYGTWSYFAVSISDQRVRIYINGKLNTESIEALGIGSWAGTWAIGQRGNNTNWYNGQMDEIKVYNYELTPDQIKLDYNNGSVSFR
jgi:hypothetical protein